MVNIKTSDEIILEILDFLRTAIPQLDLKPGTVARDLFVDAPGNQLGSLYDELANVSGSQSLSQALGSDLDDIAANFGAIRKQGSRASGTALLTFNAIDADIPINSGDIVVATNGTSFQVVNSMTVGAASKNTYRAVAAKYAADLNFLGITDQYAVEVNVQATTSGIGGNISKYTLTSTTISGVSNVTNVVSFGGGSDVETDEALKRRVYGIFSGSNTGTTAGYRDTVRGDPEVIDAVVVGPGDPLMTRDGTIVNVAEDGTKTIVSEGTGGKVDIYTFGFRLTQVIDSYIYHDKSNKDDPTDPINDFVLGQIDSDAGKSVTRKRIDDLQNGVLPDQPVNNIIQVSGSNSGSNYVEMSVDSLGRVSGNYELLKDTGAYAGSVWGFDKLHWISNHISGFEEDQTKGKFNSVDPTGFSDVLNISGIKQNIQVINENSKVNPSDRSSIQLFHAPLTSVSRVYNQTTGERYTVSNQNPDGSGSTNTSGRIIISGNSLPSVSDILQVDYTWIFSYDPTFDFDNKSTSNNPREVLDSIDWGYSSAVRREESVIAASGSQKIVTTTHPVNAVISVNSFVEDSSVVTLISNRLAVVVTGQVTNVISVYQSTTEAEFYNTGANDGSFSGFAIFLPTDTPAKIGESVLVRYNANNLFMDNGISGNFSSNIITLPSGVTALAGTIVECTYIADIRQLLPATTISTLPVMRNLNSFQNTANTSFGNQLTTHLYSYGTTIRKNLVLAPSRLKLTIAGTISPGTMTVSGTTFQGIFDGVFVASANGLAHDLSSLIRQALGQNSNQTVPSNVSIVRLVKFEKVETTSDLQVLSVLTNYDITGYKMQSNDFAKDTALANTLLTPSQIELPSTLTNTENMPKIGDRFRVTFYISKTGDVESVPFSKSGTLYTDKIFAFVDTISVSNGFTSTASQSATLSVAAQNQPVQGSRYTATYDYLAPKPNERITIQYNKNTVISDNTFQIERTRTIGADVLVKAAEPVLVDASLSVVVQSNFTNSSTVIKQNIQDAVVSALNAQSLGTIVDASDLVNTAYTISGVDRVRITHFNYANTVGNLLSITAEKNQYIQANNVEITIEER
jgi:hypothetical protein